MVVSKQFNLLELNINPYVQSIYTFLNSDELVSYQLTPSRHTNPSPRREPGKKLNKLVL